MQKPLARASISLFVAALLLVACQLLTSFPGSIGGFLNSGRGRMLAVHFRGARHSHAWRKYNGVKRLLNYPTQIQHVVVIVMENRTVDNLFDGYYAQTWTGAGGGTWGSQLDLHDPNATPTLWPNYLSANFDPDHKHAVAWMNDIQGHWHQSPKGCPNSGCPMHSTPLSYVPTSDTGIYEQLVQNWAFANNVLQANQGPSFIAHQYFISGQSGGVSGAASSPDAEAEIRNRNTMAVRQHPIQRAITAKPIAMST
jgi:phospholipase C